MALHKAHQGYEYQDLLAAYFILQEILNENDSEFSIDKKEYKADRIDDLNILNKHGKFKKQVKYSDYGTNHTLTKDDLSGDSKYHLSLDGLYEAWVKNPDVQKPEFKLCLAWNAPDQTLDNILVQVNGANSFESHPTKVFQVNPDILWPVGQLPLSSWRRFKTAVNNRNIVRDSFVDFCKNLFIEVELPKFSLDLRKPGQLEWLILEQIKRLGIGIFPNQHYNPEGFAAALILLVKSARSKEIKLTTDIIFREFDIKIDYGAIEQIFPIVENENIARTIAVKVFVDSISGLDKVILQGEPGDGKSWFIENLQRFLANNNIKVVKHYCYTNLDDLFQKERIKLNVFYGNLISDILKAFPHLKDKKQAKFASSLTELNYLLENIDTLTYLIIDGLDHIDRIFKFRSYGDLSQQDVDIIASISLLKKSSFVKIIIASQNIAALDTIDGYERKTLPAWTLRDTKSLMAKCGRNDSTFDNNSTLSKLLHNKSAGNPLYLKYLIEEVKKVEVIIPEIIDGLPEYSFNLSNYYSYLLNKLEPHQEVPRILAGVNFSLTKNDIKEIIPIGDMVDASLELLAPILKINFLQNGYIIYHESFRRYIIEYLKEKSVNIDLAVFKPIIDWLATKDFYSFPKAYRYYFQLLFESEKLEEILKYIDCNFVTKCVVNGQSWDIIEKNYGYATKAAIKLKSFDNIISLNEIDKILSTTGDLIIEVFSLYLNALGQIHGFKFVSDYMLFDGKPTLSILEGLKASYLCDNNDVVAPWSVYISLYENEEITEENFKYFIRGLLVTKDVRKLVGIAKNLSGNPDNENLIAIFSKELTKYSNKEFVNSLMSKSRLVKKIVSDKGQSIIFSEEELLQSVNEILAFDNIYHGELNTLINFFQAIEQHLQNKILIDSIIEKFKATNWFYNWLIYYIKIKQLNALQEVHFNDVKDAFAYLGYNVEPFEGHPRACDLFSAHPFIYKSFLEGLKYVHTKDEWKLIIDILVRVTNGTTTSLQGSISGPLATGAFFRLLSQHISQENLNYAIEVLEELKLNRSERHLHIYIAEYHLNLSILYSKAKDSKQALEQFEKGIEYALAYTMRKDSTLDDVVSGIEYYWNFDKGKGEEYIKKILPLAESVVDHTDKKGTQYYPLNWFNKFLIINPHDALLFLRNQLSNNRYYWIAEESLIELLIESNGKISPIVETYIALTFPVKNSEKFSEYCLKLSEILKNADKNLSDILISYTLQKIEIKDNGGFSDDFIERVNRIAENEEYKIKAKTTYTRPSKRHINQGTNTYKIIVRKEFSNMTITELAEWFTDNKPTKDDLNALCYLFGEFTALTDELKEIIKAFVLQTRYINDKENVDFDVVFYFSNQISCYYWMCRFVFDSGGWFEKFINIEAFKKSHACNANDAMDFLFELLPPHLDIGFNSNFSSNLMRALIEINYDPATITKMWENLFQITNYRLPIQENIEWGEILHDGLNMDNEELLICILISRFKPNTAERHHIVIAGLTYLMKGRPQKLIKPIQWFLHHHKNFLQSSLLIILQLLYRNHQQNPTYIDNFKTELDKLYPKQYLLIDFLIEKLLGLPPKPHLTLPTIHYPLKDDERRFYLHLNERHSLLVHSGFDLDQVFAKYRATITEKYGEYFELYWNRMRETSVKNVYSSDYFLELINTGFLIEQMQYWMIYEEQDFFQICSLQVEGLTAQTQSLYYRPKDLAKPSSYSQKANDTELDDTADWIRIASYEHELYEREHYKLDSATSYGGIVFPDSKKVPFPYAGYAFYPFYLWNTDIFPSSLENTPIVSFIQEDALEQFKILWLNPYFLTALSLKISEPEQGLYCTNEQNEIVLKYKSWITDHVGVDIRTNIQDEIPKLVGAELLIRKDYFGKLCSFYKQKPRYSTIVVRPDIR